ncbi:PLC-like phosphodiesterase [Eremomyces bilateralis CBS 781.70]|uniref:Phosphoinositide phospholipase C n=1 Tax=Eremomyces bilateralis CBS 781.70 TaxID=1392243 RepID=A0A6G1FRL6_9PEZI|nr:PLC-like phosphodiesterase [Eremomyces bilateralis CBS 781.70]KAF1808319.1 PLC-like phosphodiesterase [Eremomyces bilateralis CBS 781.70]
MAAPSEFPETSMTSPGSQVISSPSAMAEAVAINQRGPGLLRRLSRGARGAQTKLSMRRTSVSRATRDQSAGPVMLRRRSDSNRDMTDGTMDVSDLDLDIREDEAIEDLGETISQDSVSNALHIYKSPSVGSMADSGELGGDGPTRSHILQQGMFLTKVNRKKTKKIMFRLDFDAAKICWESSKDLYIDDIRDIRKGEEARHDREERRVSEDEARRWFTIVYSDPEKQKGRHTKTLHLIAETEHALFLWTQALDFLSRSRVKFMQGLHADPETVLRDLWMVAMQKRFGGSEHREEDERVDLASVKQICRNLHIHCSDHALKEHFDRNDVDRAKSLSFAQFQRFVGDMQERKDLRGIFGRALRAGEVELDKESFFQFLRGHQGARIESDVAHWTTLFHKYARIGRPKNGGASPSQSGSAYTTMNHHGFQAYMTSTENLAIDPPKLRAVLDRPLNEYFISSSHNTYLSGRQVVGESSTEPYISSLNKGCRCVEIDCWDGADGEPIVTHGHSWTSSVPFLKVINVISEYAFRASDYPLILSLEVHCSNEQQAKMANIMKETFGSKLVLEPLSSGSTMLPSPEQLRNKILIKVKAPTAMPRSSSTSENAPVRRARGLSSPFSRPIPIHPIPQKSYSVPLSSPPSMSPPDRLGNFWQQPKSNISSVTSVTPPSSAEESDQTEHLARKQQERKRSHTSKIVPVLGKLGVYLQGFSFDDFKSTEATNFNHIFSFSERKFDPITRDAMKKPELEKHNMQYLMRVYPHNLRVRSENFDPLKAWRRGVQMVALNWQTYDLGMQINDAMFAGGTDCTGFVLKPADMRPSESANRHQLNQYPYKKAKKLVKFTVEIMSAQRLPCPKDSSIDANINPYVEIEMHCAEDKGRNVASGEGGMDASARNGISGIGSPVTKRTKIVSNNGFNPSFNESVTMTLETKYPSLVFIRWTVFNSTSAEKVTNKVALGTFTAKLSSLRTGYRHLPLYDNNGEQFLMSTLFCRILKEDHVDVGEVSSPTICAPATSTVPLHKSPSLPTSPPPEKKREILGDSVGGVPGSPTQRSTFS